MATDLTYDFTGSNGDAWPGFDRVSGAAFAATVTGNKGGAGATATERLFMAQGYPLTRDYNLAATFDWANAATQGRSWGLAARLTADGQTGYIVRLSSHRPSDNTLNMPHLRVFRRRGGVNTQIVAETDISATVTSANLDAGVVLRLRIETTAEGTVNLKVFVAGTEFIDYDDVSTPIESGGGIGVYIDGNSTGNDVTVDDLTVTDFADEAADTDWQAGYGLIVNGTYYDEAGLRALGIASISVRQSYGSGSSDVVAEITDICDWHEPALSSGDDIVVLIDNQIYARGVIRSVSQDASGAEGNSYQVHGAKQLSRSVALSDPDTNAGTIYFNQEEGSEFYDAAKSNLTPGEILAWIFDNHTEGADGLRANKAAPASGVAYSIPAGLTNGPVLANIQISGTVAAAIETVLTLQPNYAWYVNPETNQHEFHGRDTAAVTDIDAMGNHEIHRIEVQSESARTAVLIRGGKPEITWETVKLSDASLEPGWDTTLGEEANYNQNRKNKTFDEGVVSSVGTIVGGPWDGYQYIDTTGITDLTDNEWRQTSLVFLDGTQNGNAYTINENLASGGRFILASAWVGAAPSPGDTFRVQSARATGGRGNLWEEMYRTYQLASADELAKGECVEVRFKYPLPTGGFATKPIQAEILDGGKIHLATPALLPLGLINYPPGSSADCGAVGPGLDGPDQIGDLEAEVPVLNTAVPTLRVPAAGYRGTAFTTDPAKWDGAGEAGVGDPGVTTVLVVDAPDYQYPSVQDADYTAFADAVLAVYGELPIRADIRVENHDATFRNLNARISLSDTGNRTTGFESATNLWLMEGRWTWDVDSGRSTQLLIGTQSTFNGINLDAVRKAFTDTQTIKAYREQLATLKKLWECLRGKAGFQNPALGASNDGPICSTNVSYRNSERNEETTVKVKLDFMEKMLDGPLGDIFNWQKGLSFSIVGENGAPVLRVTDPQGTVWKWNTDTDAWEWTGDGTNPGARVGPLGGGDGGGTADNPPVAGVEGRAWQLLQAVLDLLKTQKGVTFTTTNVGGLEKVKVTGPSGTPYTLNDDGTWTPDGGGPDVDSPLDPNGDGFPDNMGGLEGKLWKNKFALENKVLGLKPNGDVGGNQTLKDFRNNIYRPVAAGPSGDLGYAKDGTSPGGLGGPASGGLLGNVAGSAGITEDGKALAGSGPGNTLVPGATVGTDGGYYYPPSEQGGQPEVHELESGDVVPASVLQQMFALATLAGLTVHDRSDPGGVVYKMASGLGFKYFRVDSTTGAFVEVEAVTAGTGTNDGDWDVVGTNPTLPQYGRPWRNYQAITATGSIAADDPDDTLYRVNATGGAVTITLPDTGDVPDGQTRTFRRGDNSGNVITIAAAAGETINGAASITLPTQYQTVMLVANPGDWAIVLAYHPSAGTAGTPATTVVAETAFGAASAVGASTNYAREDHTHGTPPNPVTAHVADSDPHTQYQLESEKGNANGYAGLDASSRATAPVYTSGDVEITDLTKGVILKSPDGTRWRVTIGNDGALTTATA